MPPEIQTRIINGRLCFLRQGQWVPVYAGGADDDGDNDTDDEDTTDDDASDDADDDDSDGDGDDEADEDEELGEKGKKALARERKARKAAEKRAKAEAKRARKAEADLSDLKKRVQKIESGGKDDDSEDGTSDEAVAQAREQERAKMRRRIIKVELKTLAVGKLKDPDDIRLIALDDLDVELNDDDEIDKDGIEELKSAIDDLLEEKPHLAAKEKKKVEGDGDGGARGGGGGGGKKKTDAKKRLERIEAATGIK